MGKVTFGNIAAKYVNEIKGFFQYFIECSRNSSSIKLHLQRQLIFVMYFRIIIIVQMKRKTQYL